jgi:hypothetical protein
MGNTEPRNEHPNVVFFDPGLSPRHTVSAKRSLSPRLQELREILANADPHPEAATQVPSDQEVIDDEHAFRRRFGLGFSWPRIHREALIKLKREFDLTDREIRLFRHTGNLKRTPTGVYLDANRWVAAWGWAQLAFFGSLLVVLALVTWPNLVSANPHAWKAVGSMVGIALFCWLIYLTFVKPWTIRRRFAAQA